MAQVMTFPKEFERNFFRDFDRGFAFIWWFTFIVLYGLAYFMQGIPPKPISAEDIERFQRVIYRVKTAPTRVKKDIDKAVSDDAKPADDVVKEEEPKEEEKPVTEVDKKVKRQREKARRQSKQEMKRRRVQAAAQKMKVLAAPTATGSRRRAGGQDAAQSIGITTGGLKGSDVKDMVGIVGDVKLAEVVKKARGDGVIDEDLGDFDISELTTMSVEDLDKMFKEAPVTLNPNAITVKSRKGSKSVKRSYQAISQVILQNKQQVIYCYRIYKRRDSSLSGRVVVEFTIDPSGKVKRVKFREAQWHGNKLGAEVERCIENIIKSWHFDPIDRKEGNFTTGTTYIFGSG